MFKKGFTLIELLIVVAIIAILAAIAVPNFLEAQVRSKVSRAKTDMRTLATGLESYYVDLNFYPGWAALDSAAMLTPPNYTINVNYSLVENSTDPDNTGARQLRSFMIDPKPDNGQFMFNLTTPTAYLTNIPADPFASTRGRTFAYYADPFNIGWIAWSVGPDQDDSSGLDNDLNAFVESAYFPFVSQPSLTLIALDGAELVASGVMSDPGVGPTDAFTYDPTNGTSSGGDVWRVKE